MGSIQSGAFLLTLLTVAAHAGDASRAAPVTDSCPRPIRGKVLKEHIYNAASGAIKVHIGRRAFGIVSYDVPKVEFAEAPKLTLDLDTCFLDEALDTLVKADGRYRWVREGGIVNLLPLKDSPRFNTTARLETKIPKFEVRSVDVDTAIQRLLDAAALAGEKSFYGYRPKPPQDTLKDIHQPQYKITLALESKTVRQCLNAIVVSIGDATWMARPVSDGRILIAVQRFGGRGQYRVKLTAEEFSRFQSLTDRLAELRGHTVTRGLSEDEKTEQKSLLLEYNAFIRKHLSPGMPLEER